MVVRDVSRTHADDERPRVREHVSPYGGVGQCAATAEGDIVIVTPGRGSDAAIRVDLRICDRGEERIRLADIPFNSAAGNVAFQQPSTYARAAPSETTIPATRICSANAPSTAPAPCPAGRLAGAAQWKAGKSRDPY
jgi:hypothetical protein